MDEPMVVSQLLQDESDKVANFLALVGEHTLSLSVVGQPPLREVWILRFLIGFKWNTKIAAEKFTRMVEWRVKFGVDAIRSRMIDGIVPKDFPGYQAHHSGYVHSTFDLCSGAAQRGSPISIECIPKFDFETLFAIDDGTQDNYLIHVMEWSFFRLDQCFLKTGRFIGYVKIFDLTSCAMKHVQVVRRWNQINNERIVRFGVDVNECYPEWFNRVMIVNAPSFFSVIWKVLRPFLPARTVEKVGVESNVTKARERLLLVVDESVLPSFLGGSFDGEWRMLP
mmetsp:Transcript_3632/g.5811  ORF Transcript_3632/g.5811 Transcript_3632/m.5811 type:complete len:281 (-) Transcript_3632:143-985(-)